MTTPFPVLRNAGDSGSFFALQQATPSKNQLVAQQLDVTAPQIDGLTRVSDPIVPTTHASEYVQNFDPDLYDLTDSSHLMRLIRALCGPSGVGGLRKQNLVARLSAMLTDGSYFDLDRFYGAIFGLQRRLTEAMPVNVDGTVINPYSDVTHIDLWDEIQSRDAKYRSKIFQLARAVNMGATYPGLKAAAESILGTDIDLVESWVKVDMDNERINIQIPVGYSYFTMRNQFVTYGNINLSYGELQGSAFGDGELPEGNRGEVIVTPRRLITLEERFQLQHVLNTLKPSHVQVTIAKEQVENLADVNVRQFAADSENWLIQSRVTPAIDLISPATDVYLNAGPYSMARPAHSEYCGEQWSYVPTISRTASYQLDGEYQTLGTDDEVVTYVDNTQHTYESGDGIRDMRAAISPRLSIEGVVTTRPYTDSRITNVGS